MSKKDAKDTGKKSSSKAKIGFNYDDESYDENKKKREKKGAGSDFMKLGKKNRIAILPGITAENGDKRDWIVETFNHELWQGEKKVGAVGCNKAFDEDCLICDKAWKVFAKFKELKESKKPKDQDNYNLFKKYLPREDRYVNAVKLNVDEDETIKAEVLRCPKAAQEALEEHMVDKKVRASKLFHPDKGSVVLIDSNGKKGLAIRYKVKLSDKTTKLISGGKFEDEEALADQLVDLAKFQLAYDEDTAKAILKKIDKMTKVGDLDEDDDSDDDDDSVEMDDEDEDEDDKKSKKKSSKKSGKKKKDDDDEDEDDDSDDEDDEDDEDEDDDSDDDEDEDEDDKKSKKKSGKKKKDDDDDDDDDDLDDDDEDEDEDDKKSKKKSGKKKKDDDDDEDEDDDDSDDEDEDDDDSDDDDDLDDDDDEDEDDKKSKKKSSKKSGKKK